MRHIFRNIVLALLVLAPFGVAAQTPDISALTAQIAQLQAQIAATQQGTTVATQGGGSGAQCVNLSRTVAKGDSGEDVNDLQRYLIAEGLLEPGKITGFFGTLTETAVKQWQAAHGIESLGIVGPKTRTALACNGGTTAPTLVSNQCPTIPKPTTCENAVSVQLNGCTVGWQCSVASLPTQTFNATPVTGPTPLVVKFSGVVTSDNAGFCEGNFCAATLVFGDGSTGAVPLPNTRGAAVSYEVSHTYTTGGSFVANLYQGSAGSGAAVVGNGISITPVAPPTPTGPTISVSPNSGTAPIGVVVTVGGVASGANLSIEFGDGSFASVQPMGNSFGATHTYINGGSYTVKLRRVNNAGENCVSASCPVLASTGLSVGSAQVATAALVATPNSGLAPLPVSFFLNGGSAPFAGGVILDFGDNTTEFVCAPGVICAQKTTTHTYAAAGTYNVQLLGFGASGTTILKAVTVNAVTPQNSSLTAAPNSGAAPLAVTFTGHGGNQSFVNGVILKYGDDTTETFCSPNEICSQRTKTHTYADGAQYSAQLIGLGQGNASTTLGSTVVTATGGPAKVRVTGPTGTIRKGEPVPLTWKVYGTKPTSGSISFDLYTQAGARIGTILTITNFQSGTATWKVPSSADKNCSGTQPNGLCGVNLTPGMYKVQAFVSGVSGTVNTVSDSSMEIKDEVIAPSGFTISVAPSTAEVGKPMSIKYRVANPPFNGGVALWLEKVSGESVGLIAGRLEADSELTTYLWNAGETQPCVASVFNPLINCSVAGTSTPPAPGQYHVVAKVYAPLNSNPTTGESTVHATATSLPFTLKEKGTGASCVALTSNLGPSDTDATTGGDVTRLQQFLAEDSEIYPEGLVTGFYGNATRRAVERYQAAHGIVSSGSPETNGYGAVGPSTRASIAAQCSGNSDYLFRATPASGRAPLLVTFSAKLPDGTNNYSVDFGDGTTGVFLIGTCSATTTACDNGRNGTVTHTYPVNGTFIAKLIVQPVTCTQNSCTNSGASTVGGTISVKVINTTTPAPRTCAAITRNLGAEDTDAFTGGDVSRLQQFLAIDPVLYPEGLVTGFYGPATGRAVARYQASKGITQTGTVGPVTLAAIRCVSDTGGGIFSATPETGAAPLLVRFATDRSVTTGSYRVDFGDNASSWLAASSTSHTYSTPGTYTAELIQSVGNCFGLTGAALEICEIGNTQVLATKTITVATPATMAVVVTPASVARGRNIAISWTSGNAPAGSKIRLEVYRDGSPEPLATSGNDQGLTSGTSELAANGSFSWTIPTANAIAVDGGFGGYVMAPGSYHITAKLYSGSSCWGFCLGSQERSIHGTARSTSFTVTPEGTVSDSGGGAYTGQVVCSNPTATETPIMARVTLADGSTRDFEFPSSGTQHADFAAKPTAMAGFYAGIGYYSSGLGERWNAGISTNTGQTGGSISMSLRQNTGYVFIGAEGSCTVSWYSL